MFFVLVDEVHVGRRGVPLDSMNSASSFWSSVGSGGAPGTFTRPERSTCHKSRFGHAWNTSARTKVGVRPCWVPAAELSLASARAIDASRLRCRAGAGHVGAEAVDLQAAVLEAAEADRAGFVGFGTFALVGDRAFSLPPRADPAPVRDVVAGRGGHHRGGVDREIVVGEIVGAAFRPSRVDADEVGGAVGRGGGAGERDRGGGGDETG